jgi:AbrB family looped-hinge helix DNA binding protein
MRYTTPVGAAGRITIPKSKSVRDELGLRAGDRVEFVVEDGVARMRRELRLGDVAGSVPSLGLPWEEIERLAKEDRAERWIESERRSR